MNLENIYKNCEAFFISELANAFWIDNSDAGIDGNIKYVFEDQPFNESGDPSTSESWLRISIRPGPSSPVEKGRTGKGLRDGHIYVNIFSPRPYKRKGALMADRLEGVLKRIEIADDINLGEAETKYGQDRDAEWLMHLVKVPFWVEITGGNL